MFEKCGETIQKIAHVFLIVGLSATTLLSIVLAKDIRGDFVFWKFAAIFLGGGFTVYIDALLLNGFGILVENGEDVQDSKWKEYREKIKTEKEKEHLDNHGWKCVCGRVNANYVFSCSCGKSRSEGEVM